MSSESREPISFEDAKPKSRLRRQGLGYLYENAERTASLTFSYLKGGDEPQADIAAKAHLPGMATHVHESRVRLRGSQSMKQYAQACTAECDLIEWPRMVELACASVVKDMRTGSPLEYNDPDTEATLEPDWLIQPLLMKNLPNALYGPGGQGKGWLAVAMAIAVQTGVPAQGMTALEQGNVLYYDYEDSLEIFSRRVAGVARGWAIPIPRIAYRKGTERLETQIEWIANACTDKKIRLLIVDSFTKAAGSGERMTYEDSAMRVLNAVGLLQGVTVLFIDHVTSDGVQKDGLVGKAYGSIMKQNMIRNNWEIKQDQEPGATSWKVGVFPDKANHGARQLPIGFHLDFSIVPNSVRITRTDVAASPILSINLSLVSRLERELRSGPTTVDVLSDNLDVKEETIRKALQRNTQRFVQIDGGKGAHGTRWGLRAK